MISRRTWSRALLLGTCLVAGAARAQLAQIRCAGPPSAPVAAARAPGREPTVKDYEQILQRQPRNAHDYYDHGVLHERMGQHTSAILDYTQAIGIEPCLAQAYERRGAAYASLGQFERALKDLDESVRIDANSAGAAYRPRSEWARKPRDLLRHWPA